MASKPTDAELISFFVSFIREHGTAQGSRAAAAARWGVDGETIGLWLADLRRRRKIGRTPYIRWRDSG